MTFAEVLAWCKKHHADVRGIGRGMEIANLPSMNAIMHWDLAIGDWSHYTSGSDMELMVAGKLTVDGFKSTLRGSE